MTYRWAPSSRVCAIIPHHRCERWLGDAIESLLEQTRPPDRIVVVDDGSAHPPVDIVARYGEVTLLTSAENVGPYRLVQAVIEQVAADAFLFQDADDWSAPDRLEVLLEVAGQTGAELIGSHEVRILVEHDHIVPVRYPLDVNAALREEPAGFALLHPTSLITRRLVHRLGGFATGMRFSGDEELLRRAAHVARVVNADHFGYFRRKRAGSLTTAAATGLGSPERRAVQAALADRARANAAAVADGRPTDLRPWRTAPSVALVHRAGPDPSVEVRRSDASVRSAEVTTAREPVFVVGAPRSGQMQLALAISHQPGWQLVADASLMAEVASDVVRWRSDRSGSEACRAAVTATLRDLLPAAGRVVAVVPPGAAPALAQMLPESRFVHLVRDPDEVAASLAREPVDDGVFHTPQLAYERWLVALGEGMTLENVLGRGRVLRVDHASLQISGATTLASIRKFVGDRHHVGDDVIGERTLERLFSSDQERLDPPPAPDWLADRARSKWQQVVLGTDGDDAHDLYDIGTSETLAMRFQRLIRDATPAGSIVAVVSRGDPDLLAVPSRDTRHFPCGADGGYLGYHPADGVEVLDHLRGHLARGVTHLAIPATAMWWLQYYGDLREHLGRQAAMVGYLADTGGVWDLYPCEPDGSGFAVAGGGANVEVGT